MGKKELKVLVISGPDEDRKKAVVFFLKKLGLRPLLVEEVEGQKTGFCENYKMYVEAAFAITAYRG